MTDVELIPRRNLLVAVVQSIVLLGLLMPAFAPSLGAMVNLAVRDPEASHVFAAPILMVLLLYRRRASLREQLSRGSVWGLALLVLAYAWYAGAYWLNYAFLKRLAVVPAAAGVFLTVGGWRVLRLCVPALVVLLVALPLGARIYVRVIIGPETYTMAAAEAVLDLLPGVMVQLEGPDLHYFGDMGTGTIALGESNRGASLLLSYLMLGVYVTYASVRPVWKIVVMAILAGPVVLLSNLLRVLIWGLVTIYGGAEPASSWPRFTAMLGSMVLAYLIFIGLLGILNGLVGEARTPEAPATG